MATGMLMRRASIAGLVLVLTTSCTTAPPSAGAQPTSFKPPAWSTSMRATGITVGANDQEAGWDGGLVMTT